MNIRTRFQWVLAGVLLTTGCSHQAVERSLDERIAREPDLKASGDLTVEAKKLIQADTGLTPDQRTQLVSLSEKTHSQSTEIVRQSLKLRSLLIKDLASAQYDESEVGLIKSRLRQLEDKRLSLLFNAIEEANRILGREAASHLSKLSPGLFQIYGGRI